MNLLDKLKGKTIAGVYRPTDEEMVAAQQGGGERERREELIELPDNNGEKRWVGVFPTKKDPKTLGVDRRYQVINVRAKPVRKNK